MSGTVEEPTNSGDEVLGTGLVFLRGALTEQDQIWLAQYAMTVGADRWRPVTSTRNRVYDRIDSYPDYERIADLCLRLADRCRSLQPNLPELTRDLLTHMLVVQYTDDGGMGWHRDSDRNDGDNDRPIVSISLGNACDFGYKALLRPERSVDVRSGDVLVWGGPQRMLEHAVLRVHPGSCPSHLRPILGQCRINFTFRSAPNILGKEEEFGGAFWVDPS